MVKGNYIPNRVLLITLICIGLLAVCLVLPAAAQSVMLQEKYTFSAPPEAAFGYVPFIDKAVPNHLITILQYNSPVYDVGYWDSLNAGNTWSYIPTISVDGDVSNRIAGMGFYNNVGYAAVGAGTYESGWTVYLAKTIDAGQTWHKTNQATINTILSGDSSNYVPTNILLNLGYVLVIDTNTAYVSVVLQDVDSPTTLYEYVFKTSDGGNSWTQLYNSSTYFVQKMVASGNRIYMLQFKLTGSTSTETLGAAYTDDDFNTIQDIVSQQSISTSSIALTDSGIVTYTDISVNTYTGPYTLYTYVNGVLANTYTGLTLPDGDALIFASNYNTWNVGDKLYTLFMANPEMALTGGNTIVYMSSDNGATWTSIGTFDNMLSPGASRFFVPSIISTSPGHNIALLINIGDASDQGGIYDLTTPADATATPIAGSTTSPSEQSLINGLFAVIGVFFMMCVLAIIAVGLYVMNGSISGDGRGDIGKSMSLLPGILFAVVIGIILIVVLIVIMSTILGVGL